MIGTNIGAGQRERALRAAWTGAAIATGLAASDWASPRRRHPVRGSRSSTPIRPCSTPGHGISTPLVRSMASSGSAWRCTHSRRAQGQCYGRCWRTWRVWRSPRSAVGSPSTSSGNLSHVFLAMSAALAAFGLINAAAVAGGAWFGPIRWPVLRRPTPSSGTERNAVTGRLRRHGKARRQDRARDRRQQRDWPSGGQAVCRTKARTCSSLDAVSRSWRRRSRRSDTTSPVSGATFRTLPTSTASSARSSVKGAARRPVRECGRREVRAPRQDHRRALRLDLRHQREGPAVHRAEGASADA